MAWKTNRTWGCCGASTSPDPIITSTVRSPEGNDSLALESSPNDGYVTVGADGSVYATFDGEFRGLTLGQSTPGDRTLDVVGNARVRDKLALGDQNVFLESPTSGSVLASAALDMELDAGQNLEVAAGQDLILQADDDILVRGSSNTYAVFDGPSERLGVGTTSPSYTLDVQDERTSYVARFRNLSTTTWGDGIQIHLGATAATTASDFINFRDGGGQVGRIEGNGTGVSYMTTSDRRLKKNIADAEDLLDTLMQVQVRKYAWKAHPRRTEIGFIAQELRSVWPQAVTHKASADSRNEHFNVSFERKLERPARESAEAPRVRWKAVEDQVSATRLAKLKAKEAEGSIRNLASSQITEEDESYTYLGVDYSKLTPLLMGAVQELVGQVRALQATVDALSAE